MQKKETTVEKNGEGADATAQEAPTEAGGTVF